MGLSRLNALAEYAAVERRPSLHVATLHMLQKIITIKGTLNTYYRLRKRLGSVQKQSYNFNFR